MKRLLEDCTKMEGNVVCIGVEDKKIMKFLESNKKISLFQLSRPPKRKLFSRSKRMKISDDKSVKIKKFRKLFKKKSIEYLIINLNSVYDYYKYMAGNSIYICNTKVYIYGCSDFVNAKAIAKKFKRYCTEVECIQIEEQYLVIIDVQKAKYNWLKNKFYIVIDTLHNLGDYISYFLTS